jgi:long-subunit fatty acid transport protein
VTDIEGFDDDLDGSGINLSFAYQIDNAFSLIGGYGTSRADITYYGYTIDAQASSVGLGGLYHSPLNEKADFFVGAQLIRGDVDYTLEGYDIGSETANGNLLFVGVRNRVNENLELNASLNRSKIEGESNNSINVGLSHYLDEEFSLNAAYSFDSDTRAVVLGATQGF